MARKLGCWSRCWSKFGPKQLWSQGLASAWGVGGGIPESIQSDIFESFLTDRPDGTGLGLSISKRILRGHRGDIELAHSSPEGSSFHFWLPLSR